MSWGIAVEPHPLEYFGSFWITLESCYAASSATCSLPGPPPPITSHPHCTLTVFVFQPRQRTTLSILPSAGRLCLWQRSNSPDSCCSYIFNCTNLLPVPFSPLPSFLFPFPALFPSSSLLSHFICFSFIYCAVLHALPHRPSLLLIQKCSILLAACEIFGNYLERIFIPFKHWKCSWKGYIMFM